MKNSMINVSHWVTSKNFNITQLLFFGKRWGGISLQEKHVSFNCIFFYIKIFKMECLPDYMAYMYTSIQKYKRMDQ